MTPARIPFTILVVNNVLRGPESGAVELVATNSTFLPAPLNAPSNRLVIEKLPSGEPFDLAVRDERTGFVFFNIEGNLYDYDSSTRLLDIKGGRLLMSDELHASWAVLPKLVRMLEASPSQQRCSRLKSRK